MALMCALLASFFAPLLLVPLAKAMPSLRNSSRHFSSIHCESSWLSISVLSMHLHHVSDNEHHRRLLLAAPHISPLPFPRRHSNSVCRIPIPVISTSLTMSDDEDTFRATCWTMWRSNLLRIWHLLRYCTLMATDWRISRSSHFPIWFSCSLIFWLPSTQIITQPLEISRTMPSLAFPTMHSAPCRIYSIWISTTIRLQPFHLSRLMLFRLWKTCGSTETCWIRFLPSISHHSRSCLHCIAALMILLDVHLQIIGIQQDLHDRSSSFWSHAFYPKPVCFTQMSVWAVVESLSDFSMQTDSHRFLPMHFRMVCSSCSTWTLAVDTSPHFQTTFLVDYLHSRRCKRKSFSVSLVDESLIEISMWANCSICRLECFEMHQFWTASGSMPINWHHCRWMYFRLCRHSRCCT